MTDKKFELSELQKSSIETLKSMNAAILALSPIVYGVVLCSHAIKSVISNSWDTCL